MSAARGQLTPRQERAIAALLNYPTLGEAAKAAGVGESTIRRWLRVPEFQTGFAAARRDALRFAVGILHQRLPKAAAVLGDVAEDVGGIATKQRASARVTAARSIFELALRAAEIDDFEARMDARFRAIEEAIGLGPGDNPGEVKVDR